MIMCLEEFRDYSIMAFARREQHKKIDALNAVIVDIYYKYV